MSASVSGNASANGSPSVSGNASANGSPSVNGGTAEGATMRGSAFRGKTAEGSAARRGKAAGTRRLNAVKSLLDPRPYAHLFRILHFYSYSHTRQKALLTRGRGVRLAPNVSIRNGERISIGDHAHIGERCYLWAGDGTGRIDIGEYALFGPEVFVTASDYQIAPDVPVMHQPRRERDIRIGRDVWLGARVVVTAGVEIGDGCVVGAGSVVTRSLPPGSIAVGAPARVVGKRGEPG